MKRRLGFLNLPGELRNKIYWIVFQNSQDALSIPKIHREVVRSMELEDRIPDDHPSHQPLANTCLQTRQEYLSFWNSSFIWRYTVYPPDSKDEHRARIYESIDTLAHGQMAGLVPKIQFRAYIDGLKVSTSNQQYEVGVGQFVDVRIDLIDKEPFVEITAHSGDPPAIFASHMVQKCVPRTELQKLEQVQYQTFSTIAMEAKAYMLGSSTVDSMIQGRERKIKLWTGGDIKAMIREFETWEMEQSKKERRVLSLMSREVVP